MCSVWTTLKYALQQTYGKDQGEYVWFQKPDIENTFDDKDGVTEETFAGIFNNFDEFIEVFEENTVQDFIRSAYTSANLIIVPDGFNSARYLPTKDYWDLTLQKYYYQDKTHLPAGGYDVATPFQELLKKNQEQGDPLCLSPWINEHGKPNFSSYSYEENNAYWHKLMAEMTKRIDLRRELMSQYIGQLQNE